MQALSSWFHEGTLGAHPLPVTGYYSNQPRTRL